MNFYIINLTSTLILLLIGFNLYGQYPEKNLPYTDAIKDEIQKEVDKKVILFKKNMNKENETFAEIEFAIDTFKIWERLRLRQNYDFYTKGLNNSVKELTEGYDNLMNKYYKRLIKLLKPSDKIILIKTQRNWIKFRDSEREMIFLMMKEDYNTGGTIQSNFAYGRYSHIIQSRTEVIFKYYNSIILKKEMEE